MTTVTSQLSISLDGYVAGPNHIRYRILRG